MQKHVKGICNQMKKNKVKKNRNERDWNTENVNKMIDKVENGKIELKERNMERR